MPLSLPEQTRRTLQENERPERCGSAAANRCQPQRNVAGASAVAVLFLRGATAPSNNDLVELLRYILRFLRGTGCVAIGVAQASVPAISRMSLYLFCLRDL